MTDDLTQDTAVGTEEPGPVDDSPTGSRRDHQPGDQAGDEAGGGGGEPPRDGQSGGIFQGPLFIDADGTKMGNSQPQDYVSVAIDPCRSAEAQG